MAAYEEPKVSRLTLVRVAVVLYIAGIALVGLAGLAKHLPTIKADRRHPVMQFLFPDGARK